MTGDDVRRLRSALNMDRREFGKAIGCTNERVRQLEARGSAAVATRLTDTSKALLDLWNATKQTALYEAAGISEGPIRLADVNRVFAQGEPAAGGTLASPKDRKEADHAAPAAVPDVLEAMIAQPGFVDALTTALDRRLFREPDHPVDSLNEVRAPKGTAVRRIDCGPTVRRIRCTCRPGAFPCMCEREYLAELNEVETPKKDLGDALEQLGDAFGDVAESANETRAAVGSLGKAFEALPPIPESGSGMMARRKAKPGPKVDQTKPIRYERMTPEAKRVMAVANREERRRRAELETAKASPAEFAGHYLETAGPAYREKIRRAMEAATAPRVFVSPRALAGRRGR